MKFTSSWDFAILGNIGYQGQDAIFGAVYAHKGRTKKLKRHGLHGFALDQPSINGIGPINRSEKWNGRKQSETWSGQNLSNPNCQNLVNPAISVVCCNHRSTLEVFPGPAGFPLGLTACKFSHFRKAAQVQEAWRAWPVMSWCLSSAIWVSSERNKTSMTFWRPAHCMQNM